MLPQFVLPDLCDQFSERLAIADPVFRSFGGHARFAGPIRTITCFEDNSVVAERVRESGDGAVLVIDGGGSRRCALVGDNLAQLAVDNGWRGLVVYGCVRDVEALAALPIGILALSAHPLRSVKRGVGRRDEPVTFAGIVWRPQAFLYADPNGVAIAEEPLQAL